MSHSIFAAFFAAIGTLAANAAHLSGRAEAKRAGDIDPHDLPEHLQRDIGLTDGQAFGEEVPNGHAAHHPQHWADYIQTPHAA